MKENKEIFVRLERCMGCRSCEMACAVEHSISKNLISSISEKPVPVRLLYVEKAEGRNVPMICPYGVVGRKKEVRMAVKCDRCKSLEVPACVAACPTGALVYSTQREFAEMMRKEAAARIAREARGLAKA